MDGYTRMTNGMVEVLVHESFVDYWRERGFDEVAVPKKAPAKPRRTAVRKSDDS